MKQIGLFGGTFNPIHFGHINLAFELKEKKKLDEVWFIPTLISPLRLNECLLPFPHRLQMLKIALEEIREFKVLDIESHRMPPSYTIETIKKVYELYPEEKFFLIFGEDSLIRFREWREPLEIVRKIPLLIGSRPYSELLKILPTLGFDEEISSAIKQGITPTRQLEISATEIRERIKKRLYCSHFVPVKVLDYIYENQLYFTPQP